MSGEIRYIEDTRTPSEKLESALRSDTYWNGRRSNYCECGRRMLAQRYSRCYVCRRRKKRESA